MHEKCREFFETPKMVQLLANLEAQMDNFNLDELSCTLMYLNKIGFQVQEPPLQRIISAFLEKLNKEDVTLTAISRFVVSLSNECGLYPTYTCIDVLPYIYDFLESASTSEDIRLVTIALNHVAKLVSDEKLKLFQDRVDSFIESGVLSTATVRTNLKILNFLNFPDWSPYNQNLTRKLVLLMEPAIDTLPLRELFLIQKNVKNRLEPAKVVPAIVRRADALLETHKSAELLNCSLFETSKSLFRVNY